MTSEQDSNSKLCNNIGIIEKKLDFLFRNTGLSLLIIGVISLLIRLYYFPFNIPLFFDAFGYFSYAIDTSVLGQFPMGYHFPNNGWPALLSIFFSAFHSKNFLDFMMLQRLLSVIISVLTIIPVYLFCSRFFGKSYALIGAALFGFEPRIIQNSLLGITDPLYILLVTSSLFSFLSSNKKIMYISFAIASLSALVRYEGLLLLAILSIMFFVRYRKDHMVIAKYAIAASIFILVLLPMVYVRIHTMGSDGLTSHILAGGEASLNISSQESKEFGLFHFIIGGLVNLIKYLGWVSIPIFVFFVPIGILSIFKNRNYNNAIVILSIIILSIPALYAYSRGIQDTRYLYVLYPLFCVLSIFTVKRLGDKIKNRNIFLVLIIGGVLLSSSIFLEFKKSDNEHQQEAYAIAQQVYKTTSVINSYYPESGFVNVVPLKDLPNFPVLMSSIPQPPTQLNINANTLVEYIKLGKNNGLTHLVLDNNSNRPSFFKDVFNHDEQYPYLTKVYDSRDHNFKYQVKIYKIDFEKFETIVNKKT